MEKSTTPNYEVKVSKDCLSFSINHISSSYGRFTLTSFGDFILQSDYGYYVTAWPGQKDLLSFLAGCDPSYIFSNLERSHNQQNGNCKGIPAFRAKHVKVLIESFWSYISIYSILHFMPMPENLVNESDGFTIINDIHGIRFHRHMPKDICGSKWQLFIDSVANDYYLCQDNNSQKVYHVEWDTAHFYLDR